MADPAQLRKCEELLGTLPDQSPAQARNPVWVFLKGIEGFDAERARECLVRLLDKHYDTIEVIKLATKQDLVEDADILPGDALRIVAAARHYIAPRDSDHSPEPTPQNDASKPGGLVVPSEAHQVQGVAHHQHAYRPPALREKTVIFAPPASSHASSHAYFPPVLQDNKAKNAAQESWNRAARRPCGIYVREVKGVNQGTAPKQEAVKESKVVNEAAPKHVKDVLGAKDSKIPAQTHPIPVGITYPYICGICNVKCISEINCRMHYNGRLHGAKFAELLEAVKEAKQPAQAPNAVGETKDAAQIQEVMLEAKQPAESFPVVPSHACGICYVKCDSEVDLRSHFNDRKHALNLEIAAYSDDNRFIPAPYLHCSVCNVNSTSKKSLVMHFNGKRHAQNMKADSDSEDSSYYLYSESDY